MTGRLQVSLVLQFDCPESVFRVVHDILMSDGGSSAKYSINESGIKTDAVSPAEVQQDFCQQPTSSSDCRKAVNVI